MVVIAPGGGFVATFTDVTAFREAEVGLKRVNETLEHRVAERTAMLDGARREAERANDAKSRFLAAIGHDLLQPLHAAHLFVDALQQRVHEAEAHRLTTQVSGALDSTTALLTDLLDMSRLEAGGLVPEIRDFALAEVLDPLVSEGRAVATEQALELIYMPTAAWVRSDPRLLRRILQNFLSNALRHTSSGRVLIGVRRIEDIVRIEIHDTGAFDFSNVFTLNVRRDATRFDARLHVRDVLAWRDALSTGSLLPPIDGHLSTPKLEIAGAQLEGVEVDFEEPSVPAAESVP